MPATKRPKPLYHRGGYTLVRRSDRKNLEIVWYDAERKRERSASAGTGDLGEGKKAVDRRYLAETGHRLCPTCHRPWETDQSPLVAVVIADYLTVSEGKAGYASARTRLGHVAVYLAEKHPTARCADIDARWIEAFRAWLLSKPVLDRDGVIVRPRSLGAVEGSVLQLAAAINATPGQRAAFKAEQAKNVAASPRYRADVATIAQMFEYCLRPDAEDATHHFQTEPNEKLRAMRVTERAGLLRYLRMAVATWARPDAIFDVTKAQWIPSARVLDLNPPGRRQTKKHRPIIPIPKQFAPFLDDGEAYLSISVIAGPWAKMQAKLGLPSDRESGPKLIRRSISTIARRRIGEAQWRQGEMMLGHVRMTMSDIYAIPDPANLGLALAATESIIDDIETLAPGAFYRNVTADAVAAEA